MSSFSRSSSSSSSSSDNDANKEENQKQYQFRESKYKHLSLQEFWALKKKERKERLRQRNKEKREAKNREWEALPEEEKEKIRAGTAEKYERKRKEQAEFVQTCQKNLANPATPSLIFDLHFATTMELKDVKSTTNQLKLSTSSMRKEKYILRPIFVSGIDSTDDNKDQKNNNNNTKDGDDDHDDDSKNTKSNNEKQPPHPGEGIFPHLKSFEGFKKFPLTFLDGPVDKVLDPEKTTYLTADSENVLWDLKPGENYVIGAFVDHNKLKGATFNYATERKMKTARLPLDEAITVGNRCKVLTINHVVDVLLHFAKTRDWKSALLVNLPTRRVDDDNGEEKNKNNKENKKENDKEAPQRRERDEKDSNDQDNKKE